MKKERVVFLGKLNITLTYDNTVTTNSKNDKKTCVSLLEYFQRLSAISQLEVKDKRKYLSEVEEQQLCTFIKGLYLLNEKERDLLRKRFIEKDENGRSYLDYEVVGLLNTSERTYFRTKANAIKNYGDKLRSLGLWVV